MVSKLLTTLIVLSGVTLLSADNLVPLSKETTAQAVTVTTTAVTTVNYKPQLEQHTKDLEALKVSQAALEKSQKEMNLKLMAMDKANDEILAGLKKQEESLKTFNEKAAAFEKTLEGLQVKLDSVNEMLAGLKKKDDEASDLSEKMKLKIDSYKIKLDIVQDDIKVRSEEIKAIKDSISMMKNNIDSNVTDTIELKKQLREMSTKTDTKIDKGILGWENWGPLAAGIGAIALIIAIVK